ncbi:MAG: hypothetical protein KAW17_11455 [Candidatus Eisenbacteria sp.]|nr:hypothetical protein [Candidatus Eisenbacteria bacterium]
MRTGIGVFIVAVCFLVPTAYADYPLDGVYMSMLGQIQEGRFSESWVGGGQGQLGNTVHALSWDDVELGAEWNVLCPVLAEPPELIEDTVDEYGNGHRVYRTVYMDGTFWMTGAGAWGNGDPEYYGDLFHYTHTTTMQFVGGELVGYNTNAQLSGSFTGYTEKCMQLTIANAVSVGIGGIPPADYPVLLDGPSGCVDAPPEIIGEWGNVWSITLIISDCATSNEDVSWSTIKSLYR